MMSIETPVVAGPIDQSDHRYCTDRPVTQSPLKQRLELREKSPDEIGDCVHETTPENKNHAWTMKCPQGTHIVRNAQTEMPGEKLLVGRIMAKTGQALLKTPADPGERSD